MESKQTQKSAIAIDGPSASGKGTIASRVAAALGFDYLDSGALYRLTALYAEKQGVEWSDEAGVAALAQALPAVFESGKTFWPAKMSAMPSALKPSAWAHQPWRNCRPCARLCCNANAISSPKKAWWATGAIWAR